MHCQVTYKRPKRCSKCHRRIVPPERGWMDGRGQTLCAACVEGHGAKLLLPDSGKTGDLWP